MGVYWILNGIVTLRWGLAEEGPRRRLPLAAGAIGTVTGAVVLLANVGTTVQLAILEIGLGTTLILTATATIPSPRGSQAHGRSSEEPCWYPTRF